MSKLYNQQVVATLDPLGARIDKVGGPMGGVGKMNRLKLKKTKKIIRKTPDKKFREDKTYELSTGKGGKIISGKENKKLAIEQQKRIADKMTQKGQEYKPPIKAYNKGGRVEYSKGTMPARNKKNFRSTKSGAGMTQAGVKAYRRLNPGSKLKTAVTGKVKPGSKAAKRRKSFCARSAGQMKKFPKAARDPNSRLRQARRRWKC